jgi:hypothetical protein
MSCAATTVALAKLLLARLSHVAALAIPDPASKDSEPEAMKQMRRIGASSTDIYGNCSRSSPSAASVFIITPWLYGRIRTATASAPKSGHPVLRERRGAAVIRAKMVVA